MSTRTRWKDCAIFLAIVYARPFPGIFETGALFIGTKIIEPLLFFYLTNKTIKSKVSPITVHSLFLVLALFLASLAIVPSNIKLALEVFFKLAYVIVFADRLNAFLGRQDPSEPCKVITSVYILLCAIVFLLCVIFGLEPLVNTIWVQEKAKQLGSNLFRNVFLSGNPTWSAYISICILSISIAYEQSTLKRVLLTILAALTFSKTGIAAIIAYYTLVVLMSLKAIFLGLLSLKLRVRRLLLLVIAIIFVITISVNLSFLENLSRHVRYLYQIPQQFMDWAVTGNIPNIATLSDRVDAYTMISQSQTTVQTTFDSSITVLSALYTIPVSLGILLVAMGALTFRILTRKVKLEYGHTCLAIATAFVAITSDFINNTFLMTSCITTLSLISRAPKENKLTS